jgi:hypothetical protein
LIDPTDPEYGDHLANEYLEGRLSLHDAARQILDTLRAQGQRSFIATASPEMKPLLLELDRLRKQSPEGRSPGEPAV